MLSHKKKLLEWFNNGSIVKPKQDDISNVHLSRAMANLAGSKVFKPCEKTTNLIKMIGKHDHYVFLLLDGFGYNLLHRLPRHSFLKPFVKKKLFSVFPSSTAPSLTSLYTGKWPAEHGVPAWWTYLKEIDKITCPLPFVEASNMKPLEEYNLTPESIFPEKSIFTSLSRDIRYFLPNKISNSAYSEYSRGKTKAQGYDSFDEGLNHIVAYIKSSTSNTYSYLYYNEPDTTFHLKGPNHPAATTLLAQIDRSIERMHAKLPKNTKLIVTSDHGALTVPSTKNYFIREDSPLTQYFATQPSGEPRATFFHIKPGEEENFFKCFNNLYGENFALISSAEIEELELLGPCKLSKETKERIGSFVAVSNQHMTLQYESKEWSPVVFRGVHGGLSKEEVEIPLIIV